MWPNSFYRERELQYMKNMKSGERKILTRIYCHTYPASAGKGLALTQNWVCVLNSTDVPGKLKAHIPHVNWQSAALGQSGCWGHSWADKLKVMMMIWRLILTHWAFLYLEYSQLHFHIRVLAIRFPGIWPTSGNVTWFLRCWLLDKTSWSTGGLSDGADTCENIPVSMLGPCIGTA